MNDKAKRLIKLTEIAIERNDEELIERLVKQTINEYLVGIRPVIYPISVLEAPYVIAALEMHSQALREAFPGAAAVADDLAKLPRVLITTPANGGLENDSSSNK